MHCLAVTFSMASSQLVTVPFYTPTMQAAVILRNILRWQQGGSANNVPQIHAIAEPFNMEPIRLDIPQDCRL